MKSACYVEELKSLTLLRTYFPHVAHLLLECSGKNWIIRQRWGSWEIFWTIMGKYSYLVRQQVSNSGRRKKCQIVMYYLQKLPLQINKVCITYEQLFSKYKRLKPNCFSRKAYYSLLWNYFIATHFMANGFITNITSPYYYGGILWQIHFYISCNDGFFSLYIYNPDLQLWLYIKI